MMILRLIIDDAEKARERGLETVNELHNNESFCAGSAGYPVFQLPDEKMLDCQTFRELRDECGARIETDNISKLCLGIGIPRDEPGVTVID
ncbi:hypothetical protein [Syntrophotalea acetylenivorans]|nr:hypothetical protein [Syntrophotalea acetylenivorans]